MVLTAGNQAGPAAARKGSATIKGSWKGSWNMAQETGDLLEKERERE